MSAPRATNAYADMIDRLNLAARSNTPVLLLIDEGESTSLSGAHCSMPLLYQAIAHLCNLAAERGRMDELPEVLRDILEEIAQEHAAEHTPTTVPAGATVQ